VRGAVRQADAFQGQQGPPTALTPGQTRIDQRHLDILQRTEPPEQLERLKDEADTLVAQARQTAVGQAPGVVAVEAVAAAARAVETAQDIHQRALA